MLTKKFLFFLLVATPFSCYILYTGLRRETIFDRIIHIPKTLQLDIPYLPPLCDEISDLKKSFLPVKKGKLYCEEEGNDKKPALVLINGGPGGTHHAFHPYFSRIKDSAHIIYYDQRGTGKSSIDNTGKTYTIKQAVEDLESLRKELNLDTWFVLGWSYGGLLAQCYALSYPKHCAGLILIASQSGLPEPVMNPVRDQMFISQAEKDALIAIQEKVHKGILTSSSQVIYNKHLAGDWKHYNYHKPTREEFIRKALYEWQPAPCFETLIRADANTINLQGKFDHFKIPTLIIEAKWDLLWRNPNRAELMRKNHPHARVEIFEKSGHKIFADEPEKFFSSLKVFIKESKCLL